MHGGDDIKVSGWEQRIVTSFGEAQNTDAGYKSEFPYLLQLAAASHHRGWFEPDVTVKTRWEDVVFALEPHGLAD